MIAISLTLDGMTVPTDVVLPNDQLVQSILAMSDSEYMEILAGMLHRKNITNDKLLRIFAYVGNALVKQKTELNPAQLQSLKVYLKNYKI